MSQTFLPKILEQKAKEVSAMELEKLGSLRQTYSFYDYLKSRSLLRSRRPAPVWGILI